MEQIEHVIPSTIFLDSVDHDQNMANFYTGIYKQCFTLLTAKDNIAVISNEFFRYLAHSKRTILEKEFFNFLDGTGTILC